MGVLSSDAGLRPSPGPVPDVSVVVPTFRRPAQVLEAVRSVLGQSGVGVEVVVADDSPEGSARPGIEALRNPRVTYRHRAACSNGNPSVVRNDAFEGARGAVVHFLDDDDRVAPGAYRDVLRAFASHPDRGVVFGRIEPFGQDEAAVARERAVFSIARRRARLFTRFGGRFGLVANQLYAAPTVLVNSACLIRREHVLALGGYDPELRIMEDVEFYTRAIRRFGFVFLDRVVAEYRTGCPSLMNDLEDARRVDAAYERTYAKYRASHGRLELLALKIVGKGLIRWL